MTDLFCYPQAAGYTDGDTGRAAAESINAPLLRERCLRYLRSGPATADELAARMGLSILSVRPRVTELQALGKVSDTGERRPNASGRSAKVWSVIK